MKRAEDFRGAFGPAESGFEAAVRDTLEELQVKETRRAAVRGRRFLVPVIAAVLIMILGIGIAATGRWGVLNWLAENRPEGAESTELPFGEETAEPFLAQADTDLVTITVREAKTDGYGIYLSVAFTPKDLTAPGRRTSVSRRTTHTRHWGNGRTATDTACSASRSCPCRRSRRERYGITKTANISTTARTAVRTSIPT